MNGLMQWYFSVAGGHTHVRVFMNGAKCGGLCFRNEEFHLLRYGSSVLVKPDFTEETREPVAVAIESAQQPTNKETP